MHAYIAYIHVVRRGDAQQQLVGEVLDDLERGGPGSKGSRRFLFLFFAIVVTCLCVLSLLLSL